MTNRFVDGPAGPLEVVVLGRGEPVTVYAHGVGVGIDGIRLFASQVPGTRVFFHFRGHGASVTPPLPWTYDDLADELLAVADAVGATQALGVSLGAGALTIALGRHPSRFDKAVLALPSATDLPRDPAVVAGLAALGARMIDGDRSAVVDFFLGEAGLGAGDGLAAWAEQQAARVDPTGLGTALLALPGLQAFDSLAPLAECEAEVLLVAQEGDSTHPVAAAHRLAGAFPDPQLVVFGPGGLVWAHRAELRRLVSGFLAP